MNLKLCQFAFESVGRTLNLQNAKYTDNSLKEIFGFAVWSNLAK